MRPLNRPLDLNLKMDSVTIKKINSLAVFLMANFLLPTNSFAEDKGRPLVPLTSISDYTHSDGWAGAVGLRMEHSSVFNGSEQVTLEIKPEVAIQWRSAKHAMFLQWADIDGLELGWRALIKEDWFMQAGARHETVLPMGDTQAANINGFPHRGSHVIGFVESRHSLAGAWGSWVSGRLSAGPASFGYRGQLALGHRFFHNLDGTGLDITLFSSFADKKNNNNYFGVSALDSAASGLVQSDLKGGYRSTGLNFVVSNTLTANIQITAQAGIEVYSDNIRKSSLVTDSPETSAAISVLRRF